MLEILKKEMIGEEFEYITVKILNDDKVDRVILKRKPSWNNRVINITVFFKSNRVATYSGNLSNHKMPPKYRKYITEIEKELSKTKTSKVKMDMLKYGLSKLKAENYLGYYIQQLENADDTYIVFDSMYHKVALANTKFQAMIEIKKLNR